MHISRLSLLLALALVPAACGDDSPQSAPEAESAPGTELETGSDSAIESEETEPAMESAGRMERGAEPEAQEVAETGEKMAAVARRVLSLNDSRFVSDNAVDYQTVERIDVSTPNRRSWQLWIFAPTAIDQAARAATALGAATAFHENGNADHIEVFLLPSKKAILVGSEFTLAQAVYAPGGDLGGSLWEAYAVSGAISEDEILTLELLAEKAKQIGQPLVDDTERAAVVAVSRMMASPSREIEENLAAVRAITGAKKAYSPGN